MRETEERISCLSVGFRDAEMKDPFADSLKPDLGSHVPNVVETEESKRVLLQSVMDLSGTALSLLAQAD